MTYEAWIREVNYLISMALDITIVQLQAWGWDFKKFYEDNKTPLETYNIVNSHLRMDD